LESNLALKLNFQKRPNYWLVFVAPVGPVFVIIAELELSAGTAEFASVVPAVFVFASGAGVGVAVVSVPPDCKTETFPVRAGIASINADSINVIAAPMVILERIVCVPRGPKAVLETLLVKSAPASDLPGCSSTVATSKTQDVKNTTYNKVSIKI
jgi:hypothetical protein